jgi:hypothetical protein
MKSGISRGKEIIMKTAICVLQSISPYSQSKKISIENGDRETPADFEKRTWKDRCHTNEDGHVFIPPMAFANSLKEAAKYLSISVPGAGKATYTKNFEAGVMVLDALSLPNHIDEVKGEWLHVPSNGQRGGPKRVDKCFPFIPSWKGEITYHILDDLITEPVFERVLRASGALIGIGRFRPRNCGYYGRFNVESIKWEDADV